MVVKLISGFVGGFSFTTVSKTQSLSFLGHHEQLTTVTQGNILYLLYSL